MDFTTIDETYDNFIFRKYGILRDKHLVDKIFKVLDSESIEYKNVVLSMDSVSFMLDQNTRNMSKITSMLKNEAFLDEILVKKNIKLIKVLNNNGTIDTNFVLYVTDLLASLEINIEFLEYSVYGDKLFIGINIDDLDRLKDRIENGLLVFKN